MRNLTIDHSFIHQLMALTPMPMALILPASETLLDWNKAFLTLCKSSPNWGDSLESLGFPANISSIITRWDQAVAQSGSAASTPDSLKDARWTPDCLKDARWAPLPPCKTERLPPLEGTLLPLHDSSSAALLCLRARGVWKYTALLRQGEALFKALPGLWVLLDLEGKCLESNQDYRNFLSLPAREIIGRHFLDLLKPEEREDCLAAFDRCIGERDMQSIFVHIRQQAYDLCLLPVPQGEDPPQPPRAVLAVIVNIDARIPHERSVCRRDALLRSTTDLAEVFLSGTLDFDKAMSTALALLGRASQVDRVTVWHFHADKSAPATEGQPGQTWQNGHNGQAGQSEQAGQHSHVSRLYSWAATPEKPRPAEYINNVPVSRMIPHWPEVLRQGKSINNLVSFLCEVEKQQLTDWGLVSILAAPIMVDGALWGFIGFDDWYEEHIWSDSENNVLSTAANIIGLALHRRDTTEALQKSQIRFQAVEEATGEAIWALDDQYRYTYLSERTLAITGYQPEELLGKTWTHLLNGKEVPARSLPDNPIVRNRERRIICKDGSRKWVRSAYKYIFDEAGVFTGVLGTSLDITEVRAAQDALKKSNLQLALALEEAKQAGLAKSEFLANMSHEVRTPINAIAGMSRMLGRSSLTGEQRSYLDKINFSSRALLAVVNNILDYYSLADGDFMLEEVPFCLEEVMEHVFGMLRERADKTGLRLEASLDEAVERRYMGDSMRLIQVLNNLGGNAIKFTPQGRVHLAVKSLGREGGRSKLQFSVEDSGIGIAPEMLERVFSPFQQADTSFSRRYEGAGLGLAIARKLVECMGGEMWCESTPGQGSAFHFTLLLEELPEEGEEESCWDESRLAYNFGGKKVLLVEDNELNRMVATDLLRQAGLEVREAENGLEALALLEKEKVDLILMDIQMPEMDGLTACRRIRDQGSHVPILALTAHAMGVDQRKSLEAGMDGHLTKPIDAAELYATLAYWLRRNA